jgi:hypothetical protein
MLHLAFFLAKRIGFFLYLDNFTDMNVSFEVGFKDCSTPLLFDFDLIISGLLFEFWLDKIFEICLWENANDVVVSVERSLDLQKISSGYDLYVYYT